MKTIEMAEATATLAEYVRGIAQGPIIVTVNGKPVAVLLSVEGTGIEAVSLSTNPEFLALIEQSRKHQQTKGEICGKEMQSRLGLDEQAINRHGLESTDCTKELRWLAQHRDEFAGQWVALHGDRLLCHGANARDVYEEARKTGVKLPLVIQVEPSDELPFGGW